MFGYGNSMEPANCKPLRLSLQFPKGAPLAANRLVPATNPNRLEDQSLSQWDKLDRQERTLWRISIVIVFVLAAGLAFSSRTLLPNLPANLRWVPTAFAAGILVYAGYIWKQSRQIAAVRRFVRRLEERQQPLQSDAVLHNLNAIVNSQGRFRELIDSLDDALFTLSLEGEFQVANRRCAEILGVSFQELINNPLDKFITEPSRAAATAALKSFLERRSWSGVLRVSVKNTAQIHYFDIFLCAVMKDGRPVGISGLARDVTSQHESELRFSQLFESLQEGVYFIEPDGGIIDVNPAFVRMLGYDSKDQILALNERHLYADPSDRERLVSEVETRGSVRDMPVRLLRMDGNLIRCLNSCTAVRDAVGGLRRLEGTLVDITERLAIERELRKEQEFVRRLIASFPDTIGVLDVAGRFTFISANVNEHLGYTPDEVLGTEFISWVDPQDVPAVTRLFQDLIQGKLASGGVDYGVKHKNGDWRRFRVNASPLSGEDGKITGVVASARDITEMLQFQRQLLQKEKLAAMGKMIGGIAHELNNPLTAILGVSDLLRERAVDEATRRQATLVQEQARRAASIIQKLSATPVSGVAHSPIEIEEIVRRSIQSQESILKQNRIETKFSADANLPALQGDANLLSQAIQNLLVNAQQAISSVRDHGSVNIHLSSADGFVTLNVEDDGPGIRPEILGNIFDPFFTTKRPGGGAGLGLTISMAVAKEHGGSLEVRSTPNHGATFRMMLPTVGASETARSNRLVQKPVASPLKGHSILVVDDEEGIRELVVEGLWGVA